MLESRIGRRIDGDRPTVPRLVMYAASVVNRGRKDHEGLTPLRRWKSRELSRLAAEFGECVHYTPVVSGERNKFSAKWIDGVWLGVKLESGESTI